MSFPEWSTRLRQTKNPEFWTIQSETILEFDCLFI